MVTKSRKIKIRHDRTHTTFDENLKGKSLAKPKLRWMLN
jgi:hypothetical protein